MKLSLFPSPRVACAVASSALIASALVTSAGPAFAGPVRGPEARQAEASSAAQCGFFRYSVRESQFAAYGHCGPTTVLIHVDVRGHGSTNDYHLCVGLGNTQLPGAGPNYLNAYYIGGAGCRLGHRSGHTPH
ncbi:DUF6355 family natural product biosynthesis protein [Streptomyces sp. NPDC101393]|uniref:DUF6355 family natural product biosynthesis protein n=1 Tax=Streptomyces sp. NPDC101393 TaxID=3366141 RepID=UPI0037F72A87